ncbi:MAG: VOC family protein [Actinomycetota bacterium]|nr:VOC family protein [Actinomycetota bacterium]
MTVNFVLDGHEFIALNGGPEFRFNEAISFQVNCESQDEVDEFWTKLSDGGEERTMRLAEGQVRVVLAGRPHRSGRVDRRPRPRSVAAMSMADEAMLGMKKIDIAELQRAADQA